MSDLDEILRDTEDVQAILDTQPNIVDQVRTLWDSRLDPDDEECACPMMREFRAKHQMWSQRLIIAQHPDSI
eukprot:11572602-Karenia_brevis.AAC.1